MQIKGNIATRTRAAGEEGQGKRAARRGGDCDQALKRFAEARVDIHSLAQGLQEDGDNSFFESFFESWNELIDALLEEFGPEDGAVNPGAEMSVLSLETRGTKG